MKVKFFVLALFICCTVNLFAQTNPWVWATTPATSGDTSKCTSVSTDPQGNVFATGWFCNREIFFGPDTISNVFNADVFLVKYDSSGSPLWAISAGGPRDDQGASVCTDPSGNVYITGYFYSPSITFGTTTLINTITTGDSTDIFIAKYDPNGNFLWAKSGQGTKDDNGYSICTDQEGSVFVTGQFGSASLTFGAITLINLFTSGGHQDEMFIVKFDTYGNELWAHSAGGSEIDDGYGVSADSSGSVFVTGRFQGLTITFGSITLTSASGTCPNMFIVKYDGNGNVLWAVAPTGVCGDEGLSLSADPAGNVFVTGWFYSTTLTFGTTVLTNADASGNSCDMFLAKYDANGNVLWAKKASGNCQSNEIGYSVSADVFGNAYVTGFFDCGGIMFGSAVVLAPTSNCVPWCEPMFIVKYDANGNAICASALESGGIYTHGVSADRFGNAYVGSDFQVTVFHVGPYFLPLNGMYKFFVAKYHCDNSLVVQELNDAESISFYPNPSNGKFTIESDNAQISGGQLEIYNMLGEKIAEEKIISERSEIDLSNVAGGIYFVSIKTTNKIFTQKISIQK